MGRRLLIVGISLLAFAFLLWARRRYAQRNLTLQESKSVTYPVDAPAVTIEFDPYDRHSHYD